MISVIVSTRNRSQDLRDTLNSLASQTLPEQEFEVIVVDNGSVDDTKKVVSHFGALGNVRYIFEPIPGLSQARNTGIKASRGEIVAFIDDDAIADKNWLFALQQIYQDTSAMCVGGRIKGLWLCSRPRWFHPDTNALLSLLDLGECRSEFSPPSNFPTGANISFRREVFSKYGFFNTALGRGGSGITGGEETELFNNLLVDGALALYCPDAVVYHRITPDRLRLSRLIKLAYDGGRMGAFLQLEHHSWSGYMRLSARYLVMVLKQLWLVMHGPESESTSPSGQQGPDGRVHWTAKLFWVAIKTLMALGYARETAYACTRWLRS